MRKHDNNQRFVINPFEILVLLACGFSFFSSLYTYFSSEQQLHPTLAVQMKSNPLSEGRKLASVSTPLKTLEFPCSNPMAVMTHSKKIRIIGHLCSANKPAGNPAQLTSARITNSTHNFEATVFAQTDSSDFSTDYIPLSPGENTIHIEFAFHNEPSFTADWKIQYTPDPTSDIAQASNHTNPRASHHDEEETAQE